jgi:nitrate/TMAO reductase-like tetraheme cytochrome c subunit
MEERREKPVSPAASDPSAGGPPPAKPPRLIRNIISIIGIVVALAAIANILFLSLIELFSAKPNPYIGILAYMVLPAFLFLGLLLVPIGMLWERRRRIKRKPELLLFPRIDLNTPQHRRAAAFLASVLLAFLFLSAIGSYRAYEYTDSVEFCGELCHSVMHPEFIAYQGSPHARVTCVECHVGPGATWYVRSKMSGLYQVYSVTFHKYSKPIQTPVHSLRPAQDTCEQCHWPEKFHGAQLREFRHYAADETNTPRTISMLVKTGGGSPLAGQVEGIHWHMNIANEVTYVSSDPKHQSIPWVRIKDMQGRVTEYKLKDAETTDQQIAAAPKRRMDCVDCHNRPSHIYVPPDESVDNSLTAHRIDPTLPYAKKIATEALTGDFASTDQALEQIATKIDRFYMTEQPEVHKTRMRDVKQAISEVQRILKTTMFPEMAVDYRTHPNNIGHMKWPGCFRCHDGKHVSSEGLVIRNDCNVCHTTLQQQEAGKIISRDTFQHPMDIGDLKEAVCTDCHGAPPQPEPSKATPAEQKVSAHPAP